MGCKMKIDSVKDFGTVIKNRRRELGYTQQYLSDFTGISVSFISDLENGKTTIELGKALYLASLLGIDCTLQSRG